MHSFNKTIRVLGVSLTFVYFIPLGAFFARAADYYVATNGISAPPYTNWTVAATNIQDAVNGATNAGDRVLVSNGVYTTTTPVFMTGTSNIVALTNRITLKSVNGPTTTVIDGNYPAQKVRGVLVTQRAVLDGFTVRNGYVEYSSSQGGGIMIHWRGTNDAGLSYHGGTVTNCIVYNNFSSYYGGGIAINNSTGIVANCTIYSNSCTYNGGGIFATSAKSGSMINNCVFWRNQTQHTNPSYTGGGLHSYSSYISVKNCLFYQNDSYGCGGGISVVNWHPAVIENCTITANTATNIAGGVYIDNAQAVRNLIIWNNSAGGNYADAWTTNLNILTNSCIGNTNGVQNWNTSGNITNNPLFVDAITNNYRLLPGSPCFNAGLNQSWMIPPGSGTVDLDGEKRIFNGIVDMGAYEYFFKGIICRVW